MTLRLASLSAKSIGVGIAVAALHAHEHHEAGAYLGDRRTADLDRCLRDALHHGPHGAMLPPAYTHRMVATTDRAPGRPVPEPGWPAEVTDATVCLVDASSEFEHRLLEAWIDRHRPSRSQVEVIDLPSSRRRRSLRIDPRLEARLNREDDPWLLPLRIAWLPPLRRGKRTASIIDALKLGDPRDPDFLRQRVIYAQHPDRCVIVVAAPARAGNIRADHSEAVEPEHLDRYVARRALLALERAERRIRGNRYKVPKFVMEDITGRGSFRDELVRLAPSAGIAAERAIGRGARYLREIAASHSPFLIDIIANGIHWLYRQGYGRIDYDTEQFRQLYRLSEEQPLVFLPSHKSQLDRLSLQYSLWENDLPPNHTAGGINMNFFPVGPLVRRTGVFFIRRSFKDNAIYKWVLQSYLDYLVEKRFSIEFYIEGGRSRSGKLLPPRFGLLAYLVDSWRRGKSEDIYLIPTSIAYDQIQDVGTYAAEQRGAEKKAESLGWALSAMRQLRRRYGDIYIRFGEPVSVAKELSGAEQTAERRYRPAEAGLRSDGAYQPGDPGDRRLAGHHDVALAPGPCRHLGRDHHRARRIGRRRGTACPSHRRGAPTRGTR